MQKYQKTIAKMETLGHPTHDLLLDFGSTDDLQTLVEDPKDGIQETVEVYDESALYEVKSKEDMAANVVLLPADPTHSRRVITTRRWARRPSICIPRC